MPTVSEVSDRYVEDVARIDPVRAVGLLGMGRNGGELTDFSPEGRAALRELLERTSRALATATATTEAERLGRVFLAGELAGELGVIDAGEPQRQVSILTGPPASVRMVFDLANPSSGDEWDALARRMESVPGALEGYRRSLRAGVDAGRTASRRSSEAVADQCEVWAGRGAPGWFSGFASRQAGAPDADRLAAAARDADTAYGELAAWLRSEYLPHAVEEDGVGSDRYRVWARHLLGADLDPAEAYEWGWEELGRLEREQAAEAERVMPGADLGAVRRLLVTDPARSIDGVDAWRRWLQDLTDRTTEQLEGRHFDIPAPLRRCEVAIPPEGSAAAPYYTPPSEDLEDPGRVWFPLIGRTRFPTWDAVTTVFHEAVPGHHLQLGSLRLVELTRAHRLGFNSAHGEGWALYAERLMDELGAFEKPEYRLGFLSMQAFRAARVVVDIGLHTGRVIPAGRPHAGSRWSYDIAVDCLEQASGLPRAFCESEVLRYVSWPTQATCYKLGERAWLDARRRAQEGAGAGFALKGWHSRALALGPLGLDDLGRELDRLSVA